MSQHSSNLLFALVSPLRSERKTECTRAFFRLQGRDRIETKSVDQIHISKAWKSSLMPANSTSPFEGLRYSIKHWFVRIVLPRMCDIFHVQWNGRLHSKADHQFAALFRLRVCSWWSLKDAILDNVWFGAAIGDEWTRNRGLRNVVEKTSCLSTLSSACLDRTTIDFGWIIGAISFGIELCKDLVIGCGPVGIESK